MRHALKVFLSLYALLLLALPSQAQTEHLMLTNPDTTGRVATYWTAERLKAAKPMPMPQAVPGAVPKAEEAAPMQGKSEGRDGQAPAQQFRSKPQQLYTPETRTNSDAGQVITPGAVGTLGAHYTSTRVFPMFTGANAGFSADRAYPYITVGKLFFSVNGAGFVCSASAIQRRIVATAGHCVHSGSGGSSGFHSNFLFVPAFRDGAAPLMSWNWSAAIVTNTWATGGGTVPNAADYAMIEFADQRPPTGGSPVALGFVTGWLGWQTLSLAANHTSKLGYPCNLDSCQKMQNVTSGAFRNTTPNNVEYGSDALGGSSGGPWVQNFQTLPTGGGTGSNTGSNRVVGVTSYIYTSLDPKVQGASIPDNRWIQMLNSICGRLPGNCI
jgi:V8-like Glu-specific endopeptidase